MHRTPRALALATATALAVTAAGGAVTSAQDEDQVKIGFVTHVLGNPFIQQIIDGAQFAAADLGIDLQVAGPEVAGDVLGRRAIVRLAVAPERGEPIVPENLQGLQHDVANLFGIVDQTVDEAAGGLLAVERVEPDMQEPLALGCRQRCDRLLRRQATCRHGLGDLRAMHHAEQDRLDEAVGGYARDTLGDIAETACCRKVARQIRDAQPYLRPGAKPAMQLAQACRRRPCPPATQNSMERVEQFVAQTGRHFDGGMLCFDCRPYEHRVLISSTKFDVYRILLLSIYYYYYHYISLGYGIFLISDIGVDVT